MSGGRTPASRGSLDTGPFSTDSCGLLQGSFLPSVFRRTVSKAETQQSCSPLLLFPAVHNSWRWARARVRGQELNPGLSHHLLGSALAGKLQSLLGTHPATPWGMQEFQHVSLTTLLWIQRLKRDSHRLVFWHSKLSCSLQCQHPKRVLVHLLAAPLQDSAACGCACESPGTRAATT